MNVLYWVVAVVFCLIVARSVIVKLARGSGDDALPPDREISATTCSEELSAIEQELDGELRTRLESWHARCAGPDRASGADAQKP